ncbi:MAG TPA: hypothetical protein VGS27_12420 [Candidatus Sulfotelmatobacter sp.]|nr:hypothetical protein [Candidatus Sulfotelmatobacter sp.]
MKAPDQLFLVSLILLALVFQVGMWGELRRGGKGIGFYPFGLFVCCAMQALCIYQLAFVYVAPRMQIFLAICGPLACLAAARAIAGARSHRR